MLIRFRRTLFALIALLSVTGFASGQDPTVAPLMRLLQSGRVPAERKPQILEMVCKRGGEEELRFVFDQVTDETALEPAVRVKALGWLLEAAENRKTKPSGDLAAIGKLMRIDPKAKNHELPLAAIRLAAAWQVKAIAPELQKLAAQPKADEKLRTAALEGLAAVGDSGSKDVLLRLAGEGPTPLRMSAVAALSKIDPAAAAAAGAVALTAATPSDDPGPMLDAIFLLKEGSDLLAAELKKKPPQKDVAKRAVRYMYSVGRSDAALSGILSEAAGIAADPVPPTQEECLKIAAIVSAKGDAKRGEQIFRRAELSCMNCHSITRAGGQVGPELSAVGRISPPDYIASSILNPNLAIKEQFVTRVIETNDGKVIQGVVVDRDDVRVIIRKADGKTTTIATDDIDTDEEGRTLMPQGLTKFLTEQEFYDLAKFVSELGKEGPYAMPTVPRIQRWRVLNEPHAELLEASPNLEQIREYAFDTEEDQWRAAYGMVDGTLPLAALRKEGDRSPLYLYGELEVSAEGDVSFKIESTETIATWIDAQPFESQKSISLKLSAGRHKILVRVDPSQAKEPTLRIEVTKPAGSTAQYDIVGGQ